MDWSGIATVGDVVRANARRHGDKAAFVDDAGSVGFGDFDLRSLRLCDAVRRAGLRPGDRVAVLSRNRVELVEVIALARAGFIPVPLNWRLSLPELLSVLQDCRPAMSVVAGEFAGAAAALPDEVVGQRVVLGPARDGAAGYEDLVGTGDAREPDRRPSAGDVACLVYTSGTTGRPKGAMLTHGGLIGNARDAVEHVLGCTAQDVLLAVMPLFHVGGLWYYLFPGFAAGCTTAIRPGFAVPDALAAIERHCVTRLHLVPTMLGDLVAHPDAAQAARSVRTVYYAASSMPAALLRRAMGVLSHSAFVQSYGSTEAGMVTVLTADDHARAARDPAREHLLSSCGHPLDGTEVRIDAAGGAPGEIIVRSPKAMAGYWNRDEATRAVLSDGWLRTGDIGRMDDEGYVAVIDRKNDMVISGGENIFPSEVEEVLARHPAVAEAAVFGLPDPRWVESVAAAIVLRPGAEATGGELTEHVRSCLAGYKSPKSVFIVDRLPRNAAGKVLRKELRRQYGDRPDRHAGRE